jgi:tRNA-splicing ligase RtcB
MKLASGSDKAEEKMNGFRTDHRLGRSYILDMNFCLEWALINRKAMMYEVLGIVVDTFSDNFYSEVEPFIDTFINTNHNHAESKDGVMWTHRKGATHADTGMLGVIPGNMHVGSYIIQGKGNVNSMCSSSHGAGRLMSRSKAKDTLDVDEFVDMMKDIVSGAGRGKLDESPKAYKNFNEVMDFQTDLVDIVDVVRPIINVKG